MQILCRWDRDDKSRRRAISREGPKLKVISGSIRERTEMKRDPVIEPIVLPAIFLCNLMHHRVQPVGQGMPEFRYVDMFRGKPEIARQHQRGAPIDRDLQLCSSQYRRATDLIEGIEQRVAAKGCTHPTTLMKTRPPANASSG
jgi:hypothetical protein